MANEQYRDIQDRFAKALKSQTEFPKNAIQHEMLQVFEREVEMQVDLLPRHDKSAPKHREIFELMEYHLRQDTWMATFESLVKKMLQISQEQDNLIEAISSLQIDNEKSSWNALNEAVSFCSFEASQLIIEAMSRSKHDCQELLRQVFSKLSRWWRKSRREQLEWLSTKTSIQTGVASYLTI